MYGSSNMRTQWPPYRRTHPTEKEGGPTLGLVSPVYDSCQYFGIGHWTYACSDQAMGNRREERDLREKRDGGDALGLLNDKC